MKVTFYPLPSKNRIKEENKLFEPIRILNLL